MPINPDAVGTKSEPRRSSWDSKDCLLYALGVGAGADDPLGELEFTTENSNGVDQRALPTMAVVLGAGGGAVWARSGQFDPAMLVHGEKRSRCTGDTGQGTLETIGRDHRHIRQGQGRGRCDGVEVDAGRQRRAAARTFGCRPTSGAKAVGWRPWPLRHPQRRTRADARRRGRLHDSHRPGTALSPSRRPQPAALRPDLRQDGRLRSAHPAWPMHLRVHRPSTAPRKVRKSIPPGSRGIEGRFSSPVLPGEALTVQIWDDGDGSSIFRTLGDDGRVVLDAGRLTYR